MDTKSEQESHYNYRLDKGKKLFSMTTYRAENPINWTIESTDSRHTLQDVESYEAIHNPRWESADGHTGTFQTLRESLLGVPTQRADSSTVKKIREKVHLNLIKKTPSPLGKALVTLTTESVKG